LIRWPGGWFSENYRWKDGIGFVDRRPVREKYYSSIRAKSDPSWESNHFGTDEFIQFCRDVGAIPVLTVNIGYGEGENLDELIEDASAWVEYCNGDPATRYGALRLANGSPEPFGVKYWGIGNEPWEMDPVDYGQRFIKFAQALKEKDHAIKLIAAGGYGYDSEWNEKVLRVAGTFIDYLDLHYYFSGDYLEAVAEPLKYEKLLKDLKERLPVLTSNKGIRLAILEWNSHTHPKDGNRLKDGLFAAGFFNAMERQSDIVAMSSPWPLLRRVQPSWNYLSDLGLIQYDHHRIFLSPTALAFKLYRNHYAPERIQCEVNCPALTSIKENVIPRLDVVATADRERGLIVLKVINRDPEKDIPSKIIIEDLDSLPLKATVSTLNASDINAKNSLDHPDEVKITLKEMDWKSEKFEYLFPAHSVTVIRLEVPDLKPIGRVR
jgi:alpha-N-arabinofuranosidase